MDTNNQLINDILIILNDGYESIIEGDYISDTSFLLIEYINNTGSFTCNSFEAKESVNNYLENYPHLIEDIIFYYKNELDMHIAESYFTNIEKFQVLILIAIIAKLVYNNKYYSELEERQQKFKDQKEIDTFIDSLIKDIKTNDLNELF